MSFFKVFFLFLFLNIILFFYFFFFNDYIYLFIFWLCWVFVSVRGLSLVAASGGHSSSRCVGLSQSRPLFVAEHRLQTRRLSSCGSRAQLLRGMWDLPRQGSNPCPLHWQADSQPLRHQGKPEFFQGLSVFATLSFFSHCI